MTKLQKGLSIGKIVFFSLWIIVALLFWIAGLQKFNEGAMNSKFGDWMLWGALCIIPLCVTMVKMLIDSTRKGARDGSREYTVTVSSNSVSVQNHPIRGAFYGLVGGILGGLAIGPVLLPLFIVVNLLKVITEIINLVNARLEEKSGS